MHDIVVLSTCSAEMHGISLYDVVSSNMIYIGLIHYKMNVLLGMNEVVYVALFIYEVNGILVVF